MSKIKKIFILLLMCLFVSNAVETMSLFNQDQVEKKDEDILKLEKKIEEIYSNLNEIISEMERAYNQSIKNIQTQNVIFKDDIKRLEQERKKLEDFLSNQNRIFSEKIDVLKNNYDELKLELIALNNDTQEKMGIIKKDSLRRFILSGSVIFLTLVLILAITLVIQKKIRKVDLQNKSLELDSKLSEILRNQLLLLKEGTLEREELIGDEELDHALPIRVGEEIYRMRKRIMNMDEQTRGLNSLINALSRLEDEFNQQGYTVVDLTGQKYHEGLITDVVNTVENDDLEPDQQVISKMISPQILYKGTAISNGEVEISVPSRRSK